MNTDWPAAISIVNTKIGLSCTLTLLQAFTSLAFTTIASSTARLQLKSIRTITKAIPGKCTHYYRRSILDKSLIY